MGGEGSNDVWRRQRGPGETLNEAGTEACDGRIVGVDERKSREEQWVR